MHAVPVNQYGQGGAYQPGQPQAQQPVQQSNSALNAERDQFIIGNNLFLFQCACGKGLNREREIQEHSAQCQRFTQKYCGLLQAFVTLKHDACQNSNTLESYQQKMSLFTLLTSFRADIKDHINREQVAILQAQGKAQPNQQPARNDFPMQEEVKGPAQHAQANQEAFDPNACVYCLRAITNQDQASGNVQMFLMDNCYHTFHVECFKSYAKKALLTKLPNGDFDEAKCARCRSVVSSADLREFCGNEWLQNIRDQQAKAALGSDDIVQCPSCNDVFTFNPSQPNYAARDDQGKTVTRETAEHMARYRVRCASCKNNFCTSCKKTPYHISMNCQQAEQHRVAAKCRFCWEQLQQPSASANPFFDDVCRKPECIELMNNSCDKKHACGHKCKGFRGEQRCLPCLDADCIKSHNEQYPDFQLYDAFHAEEYCQICAVSGLGDEPSIMLGCKHIFHVKCIKTKIMNRWPSPRITWDFLGCPACKQVVSVPPDHQELFGVITNFVEMKTKLEKMAIERAKYEGLDKNERLKNPNDVYYNDLQKFAMFKLAYYECFKCKSAYFGGMKDCIAAQAAQQEFKPEELVCAKCSSKELGLGNTSCKTHGTDFIEFKCKFCCSVSQWFCWGTTHFCEPCHKKQCSGDYVSRKKPNELPQCPGKERCSLKVAHPPNGTEFSLGCAVCRNMAANAQNF